MWKVWKEICSLLWFSSSHKIWAAKDQDLGLQIPNFPGFVPYGLKQIPVSQEFLDFLFKSIFEEKSFSFLIRLCFPSKERADGLGHSTNPKSPKKSPKFSAFRELFLCQDLSARSKTFPNTQVWPHRCHPPHSCPSQPAEIPIITSGCDLLVFFSSKSSVDMKFSWFSQRTGPTQKFWDGFGPLNETIYGWNSNYRCRMWFIGVSPKKHLGYEIFLIFWKDWHNTESLGWFLSPKWDNLWLINDISLPAQGMLR